LGVVDYSMPYFGMQYQVLFHDTMAYGSHHHMANFKFQNIARETILFEGSVKGQKSWQEQLKDVLVVTREAYSLNLAPVGLGEKVAILLTYEDPTLCTVRLCFRVVDQRGEPVSCGFQTMIVMHKETHELVPAPPLLTQYLTAQSECSLLEELTNPSFADRARTGSREVRQIFPESVRRLGQSIANSPLRMAYPKIVDESLNEYSL
jgi:acyl-CoA thioesterase FadM